MRAKQGAVLYDEIAFETGVFEITMTTGGAWQEWRPADLLSDADLRAARHIHEDGAPFSVAIGAQPAKGIPAPPDAMHTIIQGGITRHYVAEWESIVRELAPLEPDWAAAFPITDTDLRQAGLKDEIARRDFACLGERLEPGSDSTLRDWTYKAFNRDAVVAENAGATLNVTSLFMPILDRDAISPGASGAYALEIVAPNLGEISWEQVVEFREHAGCREAREKLKQFEQHALDAAATDRADFQLALGQEITRDYMLAFEDMKPRLGLDAFRQALTTSVSTVVPAVGPMANLMETRFRQRQHQRSWRTALMKLSSSS